MEGGNKCKLCLNEESVDHLIFTCPLSAFVWSVIKGLNWKKLPKSVKDVKEFTDQCLFERRQI
jgi:hypothetical protein